MLMRFSLALGCIVIGTLSMAQEPNKVPPLPESGVVIMQAGTPCPMGCGAPAVCKGCQDECVVCVPDVKKNTKTVYTSKHKYICLSKCSLFSWWHGGCSCCTSGCEECGTPKKVNQLVKKVVPDCDTIQCVPKVLAPCETKPH